MQYSALQMSAEIAGRMASGQSWDVVVTTDMLNVAEFRSIVNPVVRELPTIVYFHENQFVYPTKTDRKTDLSFAFTNVTSALAADQAWFNSRFNLDSMLEKIREQAGWLPANLLTDTIASIKAAATIQYPGIDLPTATRSKTGPTEPIHLLWAARWEHDKHPVALLKTLDRLAAQGLDFQISVIGQSFEVIPDAFGVIERKYSDRIVNWGYLPTRDDYWRVLAGADVFISTATHEFFGLSVVEAIAAGAYPLLPDRLAYPEVLNIGEFPERVQFLYDGTSTGLAAKIEEISRERAVVNGHDRIQLTNYVRETYGWPTRAPRMDEELVKLVQDHGPASKSGPVH